MQTLMLDVDGVLITGRPSDGAFWAKDLQADLGINPDLLEAHFFKPHWNDIVLDHAALEETLESIWHQLETKTRPEAFMDYWFRMGARVDPDVLAACREIRGDGHKVCLATNQEHRRAQYLMEDLNLLAEVDAIHYSAALGAKKPDAAFFEKAGQGHQAPFLVDDTPLNVDAAQRAGWGAAHWTGETTLTALLSEHGFFR